MKTQERWESERASETSEQASAVVSARKISAKIDAWTRCLIALIADGATETASESESALEIWLRT